MSKQNLGNPILKILESRELAGITFIRDYFQFLFDGPIFNTYTLPQIMIRDKIINSIDFGYHDYLCKLIGDKVTYASEDEKERKIAIKFESGIYLFVSLRDEDRNCVEAAMLQLEEEKRWNVW